MTRRPVKTGAPDLFGDRVNELEVEVVNHLHHVDGLLGVDEVVLYGPLFLSASLLSLSYFFIIDII